MAKAKSKNLRGVGSPDFTYNEPLTAVVRFNSENVLTFYIDRDNNEVNGRLVDEVNGTAYVLAGTLTEES